MNPIKQTILHDEGRIGNCLQAALASIFEESIEDIPEFQREPPGRWRENLQAWLGNMGLELIICDRDPKEKGHYIAVGEGPRGCTHCVVYRDGKMVHDPHPSNGGLTRIKRFWSFGLATQ
jgi:hypothetical protein